MEKEEERDGMCVLSDCCDGDVTLMLSLLLWLREETLRKDNKDSMVVKFRGQITGDKWRNVEGRGGEGIWVHSSPIGLRGTCIKMIARSLISAVPGLFCFITSAVSISVVKNPQLFLTCSVFPPLYGEREAHHQSWYLKVKFHCFGTCLTLHWVNAIY